MTEPRRESRTARQVAQQVRRSAVAVGSAALAALLVGMTAHAAGTEAGGAAPTGSAADHPRLIVRAADVTRLRSWASAANPLWSQGLSVLAGTAKEAMDDGRVPGEDGGSDAWEEYPTESYAELFAFLSLVDSDTAARADYGRRARDLLMHVIERALPGAGGDDEPFRDPGFSTGDRSRWSGEAFALTLDWAYSSFSAADKARIRTVFLRWSREQYTGYPLGALDGVVPTPGGRSGDPALLRIRKSVRWSLNNYYLAHARNLGLMALALDPRDDPGGTLRRQLDAVTGQWLYVIDHALRADAAGGLSPEGFQYGPNSAGSIAQLLLAIRTAGEPRSAIDANPFWRQYVPALLHSLPPSPTRAQGEQAWQGQLWQPAVFGSADDYWAPDLIKSLGPLALTAALAGDRATVDAVRWIETHVPPGGRARLLERVGNTDQFLNAILYFLLLDPRAGVPADPRPRLPLTHFASGLNRLLERTCWCRNARLFTYALMWNAIDHQRGDGNDFGFYRAGEWLTKQRTGYGSSASFTDYHNSVAIENDEPEHSEDGRRREIWKRGDQWVYDPAGDPRLMSRSAGPGFVHLTGDATNLYNSHYEHATDVLHASRSIVWLKPDTIVVYDRAATRSNGRFKRFWLQLPALPAVDGDRAVMTTGRQQLVVTSLLPRNARITGERAEDVGEPATEEPMKYRLRVEDPREPRANPVPPRPAGREHGRADRPTDARARGSRLRLHGRRRGRHSRALPRPARGAVHGHSTHPAGAGAAPARHRAPAGRRLQPHCDTDGPKLTSDRRRRRDRARRHRRRPHRQTPGRSETMNEAVPPVSRRGTRSRRRGLGAVIALAAILSLGSAIADAAIPRADGTIDACVKRSTGALRVINAEAGKKCAGAESALRWNQIGPVGPQGPPGLAGPAGAAGSAGSAGSPAVREARSSRSRSPLPPLASPSTTRSRRSSPGTCPPGAGWPLRP